MLILLSALMGAFLYRLRGGVFEWFPRTLARLLFFAPLAYVIYEYAIYDVEWKILAAAVCWIGVIIGHGSYMDLAMNNMKDNERLKPLLDLFFPDVSFWRDFTGLTLTGILVTAPVAIVCGSWIMIIGGALKGVAYLLGILIEKKISRKLIWTEYGEYIFGAFVYTFLITGVLNA